ncbi:MAG TPA: hypothetical protein VME20_09100, partial [Acidimicrobiales bacterium]|nr:hypothetical protein [Acidimicrobiales bacterium]
AERRPCVTTSSRQAAPVKCSPLPGKATDLSVPQAVVDDDEELSGGGYVADLPAPPLSDPAPVGPDGRRAVLTDASLDGGPAHKA